LAIGGKPAGFGFRNKRGSTPRKNFIEGRRVTKISWLTVEKGDLKQKRGKSRRDKMLGLGGRDKARPKKRDATEHETKNFVLTKPPRSAATLRVEEDYSCGVT